MNATNQPWIVIKLGGVSVSRKAYWDNVIQHVRQLRKQGKRVLIIHSALSGVTNALEALLDTPDTPPVEAIQAAHATLAADMGLDSAALEPLWTALKDDIRAYADAPQAQHSARILAAGELLSTQLSTAYINTCGIAATRIDAREWLHSTAHTDASVRSRYLSATCDYQYNADTAAALAECGEVVVTQGFIASNNAHETVVLGRGGSDTSAAYFASIIGAEQLENWTDVPGLFSADPREVHTARLLTQLDYNEAQEICTSGAKILHPRCIAPARDAGIPIRIRYTPDPTVPGTTIGADQSDQRGRVKAIAVRRGITLISMETVGMWNQVGFLADAFACFKRHNISIDLVSTSETNVTVSFDPAANVVSDATVTALLDDLGTICEPRKLDDSAAISVVGRQIRANLHRLAPALELFEHQRVHMLSQAANDLNFTVVVERNEADRLVRDLHARLIRPIANDPVLGPTWGDLTAPQQRERITPWWEHKRQTLLDLSGEATPRYVYHIDSVREAAANLRSLKNADRIFYSIKANHHPSVLHAIDAAGLGFECVAPGELDYIHEHFPGIDTARILYTPNFAPAEDYQAGFDAGAHVTLDNIYPLRAWPQLFKNRDIFLRIDPGHGRGHHQHVRTAGQYSKFGIPLDELPEAARLAHGTGARVVGLHAHVGSGVFEAQNWRDTGLALAHCLHDFPDVKYLDLGGGIGVPETDDQGPFDMTQLDAALADVKAACPNCEIWLEPGRYLVAAAGVILTRVTQLKGKGDTRYVGVDTGMNTLIRPALYGAWHPIANLSQFGEDAAGTFDVVGPICETGDILGHSRILPDTREGDTIVIANAGAYGRVMSSHYNMRAPAEEKVIE